MQNSLVHSASIPMAKLLLAVDILGIHLQRDKPSIALATEDHLHREGSDRVHVQLEHMLVSIEVHIQEIYK